MADDDYFEKQNSRDCVIHSLNNAFGRQVVDKEMVLKRIDRLADELEARLRDSGDYSEEEIARRVKAMRLRNSSGKTFFSADVVWDTAQEAGVFHSRMPVPGMSTPFLRLERLTQPCLERPMVALGEIHKGTHAIAIRDSRIYDSERKKGPLDLTLRELSRSLSEVYGIYVFAESPEALREIKASFVPGFGLSKETI